MQHENHRQKPAKHIFQTSKNWATRGGLASDLSVTVACLLSVATSISTRNSAWVGPS